MVVRRTNETPVRVLRNGLKAQGSGLIVLDCLRCNGKGWGRASETFVA